MADFGTQISDMIANGTIPDGSFVPFIVTAPIAGLSPQRNYRYDIGTEINGLEAAVVDINAQIGALPANAVDLAALKALSILHRTTFYDAAIFNWTLGDYSGQADDVNIVKADSTALSVGAWVRQKAEAVQFGEFPALHIETVSDALKQGLNVDVRRFGIVLGDDVSGGQVTENTMRLIAGYEAIRGEGHEAQSDINTDEIITVYQSGGIAIPRGGTLCIEPGGLVIENDIGMSLVGEGMRGLTKSALGASVLLFKGGGADPGIYLGGTGGRSFTVRNLDICYDDAGYTGPLLYSYSAPGTYLDQVFFGSYGLATVDQNYSATGVQANYDERLWLNGCVFDGLKKGILVDNTVGDLGDFGGSMRKIINCWFYDIEDYHIEVTGQRTTTGMQIEGCSFNPINVASIRLVDINNVDGLSYRSNGHGTSTGDGGPTDGAVSLINCAGAIATNAWDDHMIVGQVSGALSFTGNRIASVAGIKVLGGVFEAGGNEWRSSTVAYDFSAPTSPLRVNMRPDIFLPEVGTSYYLPTDSVDLEGTVDYALTQDNSANKFENNALNVFIRDASGMRMVVPDDVVIEAPMPRRLTGRTIVCTKAGDQEIFLGPLDANIKFTFLHAGTGSLSISCSTGMLSYGGPAPVGSLTIPDTASGGSITVQSRKSDVWEVVNMVGPWAP